MSEASKDGYAVATANLGLNWDLPADKRSTVELRLLRSGSGGLTLLRHI